MSWKVRVREHDLITMPHLGQSFEELRTNARFDAF